MEKREALMQSFTLGFSSFAAGAFINLLLVPYEGGLPVVNIVSIVICAIIGLVCACAIYHVLTRQGEQ